MGTEALESVFGLGLPPAELVFRPRVFQFQFSFLRLVDQVRDLVFPPLLSRGLISFFLAE